MDGIFAFRSGADDGPSTPGIGMGAMGVIAGLSVGFGNPIVMLPVAVPTPDRGAAVGDGDGTVSETLPLTSASRQRPNMITRDGVPAERSMT